MSNAQTQVRDRKENTVYTAGRSEQMTAVNPAISASCTGGAVAASGRKWTAAAGTNVGCNGTLNAVTCAGRESSPFK